MSVSEWYVALFSLGAGAGIMAYWVIALVFGSLPVPRLDLPGALAHVAAEMVTGALLVGGGLVALTSDAGWVEPTLGVGLGAMVYALIQSPGFYPDDRAPRLALHAAWLGVLPALVLLAWNAR